jgi:N-acetylglucosamine malate deacetylase 1
LESQVYEGGANGSVEFVKSVPPSGDPAARKEWLGKSGWSTRNAAEANRFRDELVKRYGAEKGKAVQYAEAFEICEYGRQPSAEELAQMFPFGDGKDGGKP